MKTCSTCKWWGTEWDMIPWRSCERPMNRNGATALKWECSRDGAGIHNGEPYNSGSLATGPDFGCIHHEQE